MADSCHRQILFLVPPIPMVANSKERGIFTLGMAKALHNTKIEKELIEERLFTKTYVLHSRFMLQVHIGNPKFFVTICSVWSSLGVLWQSACRSGGNQCTDCLPYRIKRGLGGHDEKHLVFADIRYN